MKNTDDFLYHSLTPYISRSASSRAASAARNLLGSLPRNTTSPSVSPISSYSDLITISGVCCDEVCSPDYDWWPTSSRMAVLIRGAGDSALISSVFSSSFSYFFSSFDSFFSSVSRLVFSLLTRPSASGCSGIESDLSCILRMGSFFGFECFLWGCFFI